MTASEEDRYVKACPFCYYTALLGGDLTQGLGSRLEGQVLYRGSWLRVGLPSWGLGPFRVRDLALQRLESLGGISGFRVYKAQVGRLGFEPQSTCQPARKHFSPQTCCPKTPGTFPYGFGACLLAPCAFFP